MASLPVTEHEPTPTTSPVHTTGWGLFKGGMVVAVVLLLVGALTLFFIGHWGTSNFVDTDAKRVLERQKILADRNAEDAKLLHDPASFMAKDKGIVRVPIDRAIELTIPELAAAQPHAAYPVKQSPPQPASAPTSPDKGVGAAEAGNAINPPASNPTVAQPSPAPATPAPSAAPATSVSSPAPMPSAAATATPAPTVAPTPVPAPAATAVPTGTPLVVPASSPLPTPTSTATPAASDAVTPTPAPTAPDASPAGTP